MMSTASLVGAGRWINAHAWLAGAPILFYVIVTLIDTHLTTACVTLYPHRRETHRSVTFHPLVEHVMRAWLWLRTAMPTREWVAVHRCHHAHVDTDEDPHSPIVYGIWRVLFLGTKLYRSAARDPELLEQYGKGTPDDWLERHVYERRSLAGPIVTLGSNVALFGCWGAGMWLVEMGWIPFFAAGVINGLGHWWGYRNFETRDQSRNLPGHFWAIITCGESLHNNHHHIQNSPRFAVKRREIDLGYVYFRAFERLGLARARHRAPDLAGDPQPL
jgi:stearoyl-CoA desaturase (delta-9 desaturase)